MAIDLTGYTALASDGTRVWAPYGSETKAGKTVRAPAEVHVSEPGKVPYVIAAASRAIYVDVERSSGGVLVIAWASQDDGVPAFAWRSDTKVITTLELVTGQYPVLVTPDGSVYYFPASGGARAYVRVAPDGVRSAPISCPLTSQGFSGYDGAGQPILRDSVPLQTLGGLTFAGGSYRDGDWRFGGNTHVDRKVIAYNHRTNTPYIVATSPSQIIPKGRMLPDGTAVAAISVPGQFVPSSAFVAYTVPAKPPVTIPTFASQRASLLVIGDHDAAEQIAVIDRPDDPRDERTKAVFATEFANDLSLASAAASTLGVPLYVYRDRPTYGGDVYQQPGVTVMPTIRCYPEPGVSIQDRVADAVAQAKALKAAGYRVNATLPFYRQTHSDGTYSWDLQYVLDLNAAMVAALDGVVEAYVGFEQSRGTDDGVAHIPEIAEMASRIRAACTADAPKVTQTMAPQNVLVAGGVLRGGQALTSSGGWRFIYQDDGNLVLYTPSDIATWNSGTAGTLPGTVVMQLDGNLVLTDSAGVVRWNSGTQGHDGPSLTVTDGRAAVEAGGVELWSTDAPAVPPPVDPQSPALDLDEQLKKAHMPADKSPGPGWVRVGGEWAYYGAGAASAAQSQQANAAAQQFDGQPSAPSQPPVTAPPSVQVVTQRLVVDRSILRTEDGRPYHDKGFSCFTLLQRMRAGENVDQVFYEMLGMGYSTAVVFCQFRFMNWPQIDSFIATPQEVRACADYAANRGARTRFIFLADCEGDTGDGYQGFNQSRDERVSIVRGHVSALATAKSVTGVVMNEPFANGGDAEEVARAAGLFDARPFLMALGLYPVTGQEPNFPHLDIIVDHPPRKPNWTTEAGKIGYYVYQQCGVPWIADEWSKFAPQSNPDGEGDEFDPNVSPERAESAAAACMLSGAGFTFHSVSGIHAQPLSPLEKECAQRASAAMDWIPADMPLGEYTHDGLANCPLETVNDVSIVGEVAGRISPSGDKAILIGADSTPRWNPLARNGWRIVERRGIKSQGIFLQR